MIRGVLRARATNKEMMYIIICRVCDGVSVKAKHGIVVNVIYVGDLVLLYGERFWYVVRMFGM